MGWDEVIEGEKKREEGILEGFDIKISEANDLIMSARIKLGIIPDSAEETNEVAADIDNEADNSLDDIV